MFVLILGFPKLRHDGGRVEDIEIKAFVSTSSLEEVCCDVGVREKAGGDFGYIIGGDDSKCGDNTSLCILNPIHAFSQEYASVLAGTNQPFKSNIVAIGLGALGSQVFMNLVRYGVGEWILIDYDKLLPHNLARHVLDGNAIGQSKARSLEYIANTTIDGPPIAKACIANVLNPLGKEEEIHKAFKDADLILDMSASVCVARNLMNIQSSARRISIFLNQSGTDLVLLAEDKDRFSRLDSLEMQFYRAVINEDFLNQHFEGDNRIRYGQSCRDVTSRIPQEFFTIHGGLASNLLKKLILNNDSAIHVFHLTPEDMSIKPYAIPVSTTTEYKCGAWTVKTDYSVLCKLSGLRNLSLPNETGGVLIGSYDMQHKIIYVADILSSPSDSDEWPNSYIRGSRGLTPAVKKIREMTHSMLDYVGEWHSHPEGCGVRPSNDDLVALSHFAHIMDKSNIPSLMLIIGEKDQYGIYLGDVNCSAVVNSSVQH